MQATSIKKRVIGVDIGNAVTSYAIVDVRGNVIAQESFENHVFRNMRDKVLVTLSELNDQERDVLGASALAWEVPEYSLFK